MPSSTTFVLRHFRSYPKCHPKDASSSYNCTNKERCQGTMRKIARICRAAIALLHLHTHLTSYRTMYSIVQGQCAINGAVSRFFHNGCEYH